MMQHFLKGTGIMYFTYNEMTRSSTFTLSSHVRLYRHANTVTTKLNTDEALWSRETDRDRHTIFY